MDRLTLDEDGDLVCVQDALIVPPKDESGARNNPFGVLGSDGNFISNSISWTDSTSPDNSKPDMPSSAEPLAGTWMFGGTLYGHFGHFILESLSRVWALEELREKIAGVVFTPKRNNPQFHQVIKQLRPLMDALGVDVEAQVVLEPTRVETLYVPRQGIGMHDLMEGSRKFRNFMKKRAGAHIAPNGASKIYISRSKLPPHRGGLIGENILENRLAAEGYEMFHPQNHSAEEQIAAYKAATHVIAVDCSPLHLLAYVGNASQKVGILTRRSMAFSADFVRHLRAFNNGIAFEVDALERDWIPGRGLRPSRSSFGEMNFAKAWETLRSHDMVSGDVAWPALTDAERQQDLTRIADLHGVEFHPLEENIALRDSKLAAREAALKNKAKSAAEATEQKRPKPTEPALIAASSAVTPIMPIAIATPWAPQPPEEPRKPVARSGGADAEPGGPQKHHAPKWLVDFRRSAFRRGFYYSEENFAAIFANRGVEHLLVTFDDLPAIRIGKIDREAWGYGMASKAGWSHLGIFSFRPNWYRDATLIEYLENLRDSGFFKQFKSVTFSGSSMGGYAACAFSSLVEEAQILAFSPQSTLDTNLVPWDERYPAGRAESWDGPFADAAVEAASARKVFLVYDPREEPDRKHAQRFTSDNVVHLTMHNAGRDSVLRLSQSDMLADLMHSVAAGELDPSEFKAKYRTVRKQTWYLQAVCSRVEELKRPELLERVARFSDSNNLRAYAERVRQRADALRSTIMSQKSEEA